MDNIEVFISPYATQPTKYIFLRIQHYSMQNSSEHKSLSWYIKMRINSTNQTGYSKLFLYCGAFRENKAVELNLGGLRASGGKTKWVPPAILARHVLDFPRVGYSLSRDELAPAARSTCTMPAR
jgi:hypothetical protein